MLGIKQLSDREGVEIEKMGGQFSKKFKMYKNKKNSLMGGIFFFYDFFYV